jgi:citrate lyase beta subunit
MIDPISLGATLFVPANHKNLLAILSRQKYPTLRSLVIDTEDGLDDAVLESTLEYLYRVIQAHQKNDLHVFVRPRNPDILKQLLACENIGSIDGFVLPKFSTTNAQVYLELLKPFPHAIMPSIEGDELFDMGALKAIKDQLLPYNDRIVLVRFGLEDMLKQMQMKRDEESSIFDYAIGNYVLGCFLSVFKSAGFYVSGGVYPYFNNKEGFVKDAKRDLKEGLFSKTVIHPNQVEWLDEVYKVDQEELDHAKKMLEAGQAVINIEGSMGEVKTMNPHAQLIAKRADIYGVR